MAVSSLSVIKPLNDRFSREQTVRIEPGEESDPNGRSTALTSRSGIVGSCDCCRPRADAEWPPASPLAKTMFVAVANRRANSGYIPTDDAYGRYRFQVVASRLKPGCAQDGIVKGITDMIDDYAE